MRRRQFLVGFGLGVAGAAGCAHAARPSKRDTSKLNAVYGAMFRKVHASGKPMMVASVASEEDRLALKAAYEAIRTGADRELAVRRLLVCLLPQSSSDLLDALTDEAPRFEAPSIVLVDGEQPRIVKQAKLDRANIRAGLEQFFRDNVALDLGWLEPRATLLERHEPDLVAVVRSRMAADQPIGLAGVQAAAVVVLEALRRTGAARETLIADLAATAPEPVASPRLREDRALIDFF